MLSTQNFIEKVRKIDASKNYWFVRTQGGDYFNDFANGNFVAIGHDQILLSDVSRAKLSPNPSEALGEKVRKYYEENKMPTHTANQILKFAYEIKKGDIVFIPSSSSSILKFGEVLETPAYLKSDSLDKDDCPFEKRKKVRWFKSIKKKQLDPNLYKLIYSHHTITNAKDYEQYIDKSLYSFFIKEGKGHLVIDVTTTNGIKAKELFRLGLDLFDSVDTFGEDTNIKVNSDDVEAKVNLNSPGTVEFISQSVQVLAIIGMIIVFLNGGEFEVNLRITKVKMKSQGFISKLSNFLNENKNRKIKDEITEHIKKLKIESPDDITKILSQLNKDNGDGNNKE